MAERVTFGRLRAAAIKRYGPLAVRHLVDAPRRRPFSCILVSIAPGESHPPIRHARTWEFFVVLRGSNRALIGGKVRQMRAGDYACMPPGTSHAFTAGRAGVDVLVVFAPAMDFLRPDIAEAR